MEGPTSVMYLRTRYRKNCKPPHSSDHPSELGQARSCGCSCRTTEQRWPIGANTCTLPIIPEYPGFQDIKLSRNYLETPAFNRFFQDLQRRRSFSSQMNNFPCRDSLVHGSGSSARSHLKGHSPSSGGFHDKPLQEYFNERLMELRNYESKRSNRKTKVFSEKNQNPFLTHRLSWRRSSCSAVVVLGHGKESQEPCSSANQDSKKLADQEETQNVPNLCKGDFLDILTMHITAPLEALVQKK